MYGTFRWRTAQEEAPVWILNCWLQGAAYWVDLREELNQRRDLVVSAWEHIRPRGPEDDARALHEAEDMMARGALFERQRVEHPPYDANTVQDEQDLVDDEREAQSDPDQDETSLHPRRNDPDDDDQTCDEIEMVDPDMVEEVGTAGLDDTQAHRKKN